MATRQEYSARYNRWTATDEAVLDQMKANGLGRSEIATIIGRTPGSIDEHMHRRRKSVGLSRSQQRRMAAHGALSIPWYSTHAFKATAFLVLAAFFLWIASNAPTA